LRQESPGRSGSIRKRGSTPCGLQQDQRYHDNIQSICDIVTLVQRYVFPKLEVSMTFLFRKNRMHGADGQTDRRDATLNVSRL